MTMAKLAPEWTVRITLPEVPDPHEARPHFRKPRHQPSFVHARVPRVLHLSRGRRGLGKSSHYDLARNSDHRPRGSSLR
jgi:hypothetical protein